MSGKSLNQVTQNIPEVSVIIQQIYKTYSNEKADIIVDNLTCRNIVGLELLYRYKECNFNIEDLIQSINL